MRSSETKGQKKASGIVFTGWHIWNIAADAAQRAKTVRSQQPRACTADTISAIVLSAMAAEAFINELAFRLSDSFPPLEPPEPSGATDWVSIGQFLVQLENERVQVKSKYLLAAQLLPGEPLRLGSQPYHAFNILIDVRNDLAHQKASKEAPKYLDFFTSSGWTYNAKADEVRLAGWLLQIETPEIATWACRASHNIMWNIVERFDGGTEPLIKILFEELEFQWGKTRNDLRSQ